MQTSGELLLQARLKSKLTLTQVEKLTKIPKFFLKALEKNQFSILPSATYIQGFIQNYAQVVKLDPQKTIAVFKRDYHRQPLKKIIPQSLIISRNPLLRFYQPLIAISLLLIYLGFNLYHLYRPPQLILFEPKEAEVTTSPIMIKGKTDRDAALTLNGKTINLESDGRFTTVYNGTVGALELKFISASRRQKTSSIVRHVIIIP